MWLRRNQRRPSVSVTGSQSRRELARPGDATVAGCTASQALPALFSTTPTTTPENTEQPQLVTSAARRPVTGVG
jgi:hypothetical protein